MTAPAPLEGIYNTSGETCQIGANLRGRSVRCMLARDHHGWAHQNTDVGLIWSASQWTDPAPSQPEGRTPMLQSTAPSRRRRAPQYYAGMVLAALLTLTVAALLGLALATIVRAIVEG